jgi:eukaryotic-like serine/threonine-protein kinase
VLGAGTTLSDRYRLTTRIGGGGMGEVWRASDVVLGREVAVKVLTPALTEHATFVRRFQNEARAMATLRHPGVVDVYDYGLAVVGGRTISYLVMEYVPGESLDLILRRRPLSQARTMQLVAEVADALAAAHAQGIVHRDVKPGNLLVRPDGRVALGDFGIAHSASAGQLTATGAMLCSAGYCAPEMATASDVSPAVDVYALGVVAYECLTGRLPFDGDTPVQIIYKHLHSAPPPLPDSVAPGPRGVVTKALEKTPERRWSSAEEMGLAARRALTEPREPLTPKPRRTLVGAFAVGAALAVSATVVGMLWMRPATPAEDRATLFEPAVTTEVPTPTRAPVRNRPPAPSTKPPKPPKHPPTTTHEPKPKPTVTPTPTLPTSPPTSTKPPEPTPTPPPVTSEPPKPTQVPPAEPSGEIQCIREPCP